MRRITHRRAVAGGAVVVALLAGCAPAELPQPDPDPVAETPAPVLDAARTERILQEVADALAAGDEAQDVEAMSSRVIGPARDIRQAEYRLAEETDGDAAPGPLTTEPQVEAVAATTEFPRTAMVITQVPEGANLPLLMALTQGSARQQFALWGWVELFPGIETPALVHPDTGSAQVPNDATGLVAAPAEVVERYAEALTDPEGEAADLFAEDPFATSVREGVTGLDDAVEAGGEATLGAEAGDDGPVALATADGGAIVMGEITTATTIRKTVAGATVTAGGALGRLLGEDAEVRGTVTGTSLVLLAFYVPPADAEDQTIRALGANTVLSEVTRDDAAAPAEEPAEEPEG